MQPLSHLRKRCVSTSCPGVHTVEPDGVSRCRLRPPTSQAAAYTDLWRRISDIRKKLTTRGTGAGAGKRKKKTNKPAGMLHSLLAVACQAPALAWPDGSPRTPGNEPIGEGGIQKQGEAKAGAHGDTR